MSLDELESFIKGIRKKNIYGINVTVPFKKAVIPYLDKLSLESEETQSINTIYFHNDKIIGHNTDIDGFKFGIEDLKVDTTNKKILILGAGGVVPSIIFALYKMNISDITITNRSQDKAKSLKSLFKNLKIIDWGDVPEFDIIINATSVGLNKNDNLNLDFSEVGQNKLFYDVIYNPKETNFLKEGKKLGNRTENGKLMFIYQASAAFRMWHGVWPKINDDVIKLLD